ncbi:TlpA family protein disulfide reductase [Streptomyces sp. NPDC002514]|uniref:TlpA family protein disulfide reductase n=1 Tax=Streptomyces sp. NPDC001270 TaxID=3364554 RepID=UPI0036771F93
MFPGSLFRTVALAALVALGSLSLSACGSGSSTSGGNGRTDYVMDADGIATVAEGERNPAGPLKGEDLQGGHLDVAAFRGKVVVINVWGSWCPPCRAEAPYLNKVAREMKPQGVEFVGINTRDGDKHPAKAFEDDFDMSYPSLYDPTGKLILSGFPKGTVSLQGLPVTIALDRNGKIAARIFGGTDGGQLHRMLDPLVEEK